MFQSTVLFLALCAGTLVEPFRIAEAEQGHHQGCLRAAMTPDGSPVGSAQTLVPQVELSTSWRPIGLSLANNEEFAVTWSAGNPASVSATSVWVQRFDRDGYPKDNAFLAHDDYDTIFVQIDSLTGGKESGTSGTKEGEGYWCGDGFRYNEEHELVEIFDFWGTWNTRAEGDYFDYDPDTPTYSAHWVALRSNPLGITGGHGGSSGELME
jgi:hypothetical protein